MAKHNDKAKTSKTARVMSLLSKKHEPVSEPDEETVENSAPENTPPVPPILSSLESDAAVSVQIRDALEGALADELGVPDTSSEPEQTLAPPVQTPAPAEQAQDKTPAPAEPVDEDGFQVLNAPQVEAPPAQPEQSEQDAQTSAAIASALEDTLAEQERALLASMSYKEAGYVNVMQVLVEEKVNKYAGTLGLCTCKRCLEDVKALTLNHLPPKYVVIDQGHMVPRITFYEGQYSTTIMSELVKACAVVLEHPHHSRS